MKLIIDIPKKTFEDLRQGVFITVGETFAKRLIKYIKNGTPLPKGHGRIVDIGKIDEDRIDHDNPIIYLTINGENIEAVSLDYLNNLSTIIEADKAERSE